jgi:Glycosyl hydrolase family 99
MKSLIQRTLLVIVVVVLALLSANGASARRASAQVAQPSTTQASQPKATQSRPPVFAYYYIWFDPTSWQRAKRDYPLLGRYSSDQRLVMEQHVRWAKQAGITGLLVSWKHSVKLDRRLAMLADVAAQQGMSLGIVYQGLDFARQPLPAARVASDFDFFTKNFASRPAFKIYDKPLVIWTGTWAFSATDIASVTTPRRSKLLILASERNTKGYDRVENSVDGDAYYWSSVDPNKYPNYDGKLAALGADVHQHRGLWIAPASAGFDGRLIGAPRVVPRRNGETLRTEWNAAMQSGPDAIGVISWNEFSENSYIEPSEKYGRSSLETLASLTGAPGPSGELDSNNAAGSSMTTQGVVAIVFLGAVVVLSAALLRRRSRRAPRTPGNPQGGQPRRREPVNVR